MENLGSTGPPTSDNARSLPRDIARSPQPTQDLPSRSYYSSHIHYETSTSPRYSASIESIRAQSLALGDLYMNEPDKAERDNDTKMTISPATTSTAKPSPPAALNPISGLSLLINQQNAAEQQQPDEYQPLLKHPEQNLSVPAEYQSISVDTAENGRLERVDTHHRSSIKSVGDKHPLSFLQSLCQNKKCNWTAIIKRPIECIPAVILGLLLNLLDAISYGKVADPTDRTPIGCNTGTLGCSCIVAQIVYSCGGSAFDGGNGRAEQIVQTVGEDQPQRVISSTVVAFAISSIMTGLAFFLLGALRLGSLIGFFPRHILVGTIGGVGWFLVATGIEVSGRLDEDLTYTIPMFKKIFLDTHTFALWSTALGMAILLRIIQHRITSPLVVPLFFLVLPVVFFIVIAIAGLDINQVRDAGWIFPLVESDLPFWHFYTYYDFTEVDWRAVAQTLPAMLALTFFGVLHVPINVPALGVSTNKDDVDVNRELVAHGVSNGLSGCFGAVQNYLVYTNSLLFIRTGGDSRLAGLMLAGATAILWMVGPWIVGYIPVMVVGSLIFHLGLDLLKEALIDTWHSVHYLEYITICVIVACMATLGFVEGILVGIILACVFFVVQNARRSQAIRATHTGQLLRSTVRRLYRQQKFLNHVGKQIQVIKLQGYLFFGTINQVERAIRDMLDERAWDQSPIRFLVLDLQLVQGLDFSAAEAFVRIRRLLRSRQVFMIICNVARQSDQERALVKAGMWVDDYHKDEDTDLKCFEYLNEALEWCENVLLQSYFARRPLQRLPYPVETGNGGQRPDTLPFNGSPRHTMLSNAVQNSVIDTHTSQIHANMSQPTQLLVQALGDLTERPCPVEFFHRLGSYFEREPVTRGKTLWREGDPCDYLLLLEHGSLRSLMHVNHDEVTVETILPGTVVGELGLFTSNAKRSRSLVVEQDSVIWKLSADRFMDLIADDPQMANRFVLLTLYFSSERLDIMTRYAFQLH
ncbi:hypothetical protein EC973_008966 [Apophysomyces ossiformis]|uniref:Sulfate transporter n=1 Tax=Apophysomyces ossiformis TaxID=679940 RepID=A0A8H7BPU7_9FUNG|nr:hypothetical protein EC973_008966 [Apophysomyces ossiformis]